MRNVNKYVAWIDFRGDRTAKFQGVADSEEEFRQMCADKGFDLSEVDEVECIKENVKDSIGKPCKKQVTQDF